MYLHHLSLSANDYGPLARQLALPHDVVGGVSGAHIGVALAVLCAPALAVWATDCLGRVWVRQAAHVDEPAPLMTLGYG